MAKDSFKKQKAERLRKEGKARAYAKSHGQYKCVVMAQLACGCCNSKPMHFLSEESCEAKFKEAGLDVGATIVDDSGVEHKEVDTFYGYRHPKDAELRGLNYLIDQL
jgi:hypothetical protein